MDLDGDGDLDIVGSDVANLLFVENTGTPTTPVFVTAGIHLTDQKGNRIGIFQPFASFVDLDQVCLPSRTEGRDAVFANCGL